MFKIAGHHISVTRGDSMTIALNVTKKDGEAYHDKISSILNSNNDEAIKLKYADMSDNYNEERLSKLDIEIQTKLRNKYQNEYIRLESYLKERNLL